MYALAWLFRTTYVNFRANVGSFVSRYSTPCIRRNTLRWLRTQESTRIEPQVSGLHRTTRYRFSEKTQICASVIVQLTRELLMHRTHELQQIIIVTWLNHICYHTGNILPINACLEYIKMYITCMGTTLGFWCTMLQFAYKLPLGISKKWFGFSTLHPFHE